MSANPILPRPVAPILPAVPLVGQPVSEPADIVTKLGTYVLAAYLFCAYGRIPELMAVKLGFAPPVMPVLMAAAMLMSVAAGGLFRFIPDRLLHFFAAYYCWIVICVPLSIWKGTSLELVLYELKMSLIFVAIVSLVRTTQQLRNVLIALAASMIVLTLAGQTMSAGADERFSFDAGSLANPNELANHLLIGLPLCWVIAIGSKPFSWQNLVRYLVVITSGVMLLKTGSRGGIVTVIILAVVLLFSLSLANKVKFVVACMLAALLAGTVASHAVMQRYRTLISDDTDISGEAIASKNSRTELLRASLHITMQHPVFGVGPGAFVMAYNQERYAIGLRHHWEATHNAYTQVSSETGVPGLVFFVGSFAIAIRRLLALRKTTKDLPQFSALFRTSSVLLLAIVAYLSSGFFTSNAHEFYFPILIGLSLVLVHCGNEELRLVTCARPAIQQPLPVTPRMPHTPQRPLPPVPAHPSNSLLARWKRNA